MPNIRDLAGKKLPSRGPVRLLIVPDLPSPRRVADTPAYPPLRIVFDTIGWVRDHELRRLSRQHLNKLCICAVTTGKPVRTKTPNFPKARDNDLPDQRNVILWCEAAYLLPGDFCDIHVFILTAMDHSIGTLSPCRVVDIPRHDILKLTERPAIARALWWATLVDEATLREWLLNVGQREAAERVAHLLCELLLRLRAVGSTSGDSYSLPITQAELADTVGVSAVHANRALQRLRETGLIVLKGGQLFVPDTARLFEFSGFNPNYVHLEGNPDRT